MLSIIWSTVAALAAPALSNIGEWTYVDYAYRISIGELPVQGDNLSPYTLETWSCRGMDGDIRGETPPPCDEVTERPVTDWPLEGENYNTFHPPLYFAFAAGVGKIADTVGIDFTDGARFASALFGAVGVAALYGAIRCWGIGKRNSAGATLIAMSVPALALSSVIVHNDAVSMMAGAAAVWLAARVVKHGNYGWIPPFLIAAGISLTRTMSVVAVLAVGGLAILMGLFQKDQRGALKPGFAIALGTMLSYVAWTVFQNGRRPEDYVPSITGLSTDPFTAGDTLAVINTIVGAGAPWGLTRPSRDWYLDPSLNSWLLEGWSWLLFAVFLIAVPVGIYCAIKRTGALRYLGILVVLLPILTGLIVQAREIASVTAYFRVVPGRYAITAVPLYVAFIAALAQQKDTVRWVLPAVGMAGYAVLLLSPLLP